MEISQMNAGQAYECMVRMVPHAAELVSDPQIVADLAARQRAERAKPASCSEEVG